jgi:hypothetical protein
MSSFAAAIACLALGRFRTISGKMTSFCYFKKENVSMKSGEHQHPPKEDGEE